MRHIRMRMAVSVALASVALVVAACGSDNNSSSSSSSRLQQQRRRASKIALLLPESKTTRYEAQDRPLFEAKLKALCPNCQIIYSNADQDASKQQQQAEAAITQGAKVLVLDPVDAASAAAIVDAGQAVEHPGDLLRPARHQRGRRLLHLVRQREGRQAPGQGAARQALEDGKTASRSS